MSGSDPINFGSVAIGGTRSQSLTVTNSGNIEATNILNTGMTNPFQFKGGSYPGTGGTCGLVLGVGESCILELIYQPTATGSSSQILTLSYSNGPLAGTQTLQKSLSGAGVNPGLISISDSPQYDFGNVPLGGTATHTLTLSNIGGASATSLVGLNPVTPFGYLGGSYPGVGGTCGTILTPGSTCSVVIEWSPVTVGSMSGSLDFNYDDGVSAQVVQRFLAGTSSSSALIEISESSPFDFGNKTIGSVNNHVFVLTNNGGSVASSMAGLGVTAPFSFTGGGYPGSNGTCGTTLAPGASCEVHISLTPVVVGAVTNHLEISYNDGFAAQILSLEIIGQSVHPALLVLDIGAAYDFGNVAVGGSQSHTVVVSNTGGSNAISMSGGGLSSPFSFLGGAYPGVGGTCGNILSPGSSCTLVIEFKPVTIASSTDSLNISYSDGVVTQTVVSDLSGVGLNPGLISVSGVDPIDFGSVVIGQHSDQTLTLTNIGGMAATSVSASGLGGIFDFPLGYPGTGGTCGAILVVGSSCTIVVRFEPTAAGTTTATVDISYNDGVQFQIANRQFSGTGL